MPPYVPTVVFWALTPLLLQPFGAEFRFASVLSWSADPVLALFLGGFTLSVAATRYGLDAQVAHIAIQLSHGRRLVLLVLVVASTAALSMWMSNIAAAAMMIAALRPLFSEMARDTPFRRALLMGVAIGANFGGIATPVGTGPNAIAIAAVSKHQAVTFLSWMAFAFPLTLLMLIAGIIFFGASLSCAWDGETASSSTSQIWSGIARRVDNSRGHDCRLVDGAMARDASGNCSAILCRRFVWLGIIGPAGPEFN